MTAKLWELSAELRDFETKIDSVVESDLSPEDKETQLQQLFDEYLAINEDLERKCEAVAAYIKRLEALTEARKAEAKRLTELARQSQNQADSLPSGNAQEAIMLVEKQVMVARDGGSAQVSFVAKEGEKISIRLSASSPDSNPYGYLEWPDGTGDYQPVAETAQQGEN